MPRPPNCSPSRTNSPAASSCRRWRPPDDGWRQPATPNARSRCPQPHCDPATSSTWRLPTWCPPMLVCWWPRISRSTNLCSPVSRCRSTSRSIRSRRPTPSGPACCSRAARSLRGMPGRSWWPPVWAPRRTARSQPAPAQRRSPRGVLVRAPRTIEALGRVDTICFDKTGTLTENRLRLVRSVPAATNPHGPFPGVAEPEAARVLQAAARATTQPHEAQGHAHATDEAIVKAAASLKDDVEWNLLAEVPFESSRGFAASIGTLSADATKPLLMLKGAPEVILPRCRFDDPQADQDHAESLVHNLAEQGLRVLAVAKRSWVHDPEDDDDTDADAVDAAAHDLELIGYVGLADTARPSARPVIEALLEVDRDVVLITGDHPGTARAIARQLGLPADARVVTGADLNGLDEDASAKLAADVQVFARVSPEQKVQIVGALQRCGRVTAMVGDGANDAAAIRMADVGIGVSGRGSSAARGAADIVLTDDDLTVLLDTLVEGRGMWAGVRDAVTILVGGNVGEVLFTIIGTALGTGRAPVGTRQLLLVNLLTDMFPALAVAVTPQL